MYTCVFRINANLVKEVSFPINAKLVKEELMTQDIVYDTFTITFARELVESRDTRSTTLTSGEIRLILSELLCSYLINE